MVIGPGLTALVVGSLLVVASAGAEDLPAIKQRGVLRVLAVLEEKAPEFVSTQAGRDPGFDREVLDAFGRTHGVKVELVLVPAWDQLLPWLQEGKGDLIGGRVSNTADRRKTVDFTDEVFPTRIVALTRKPTPPVATLAQLAAHRKVHTIRGTSMVDALRAAGIPEAKIDVSPIQAGTIAEALRAGEVTAAAWSLEASILAHRRDPDIQLGMFLSPPESLAYGVPKGTPLLLAALNDHIRVLKQSGTWNRLAIKYFGDAAPQILKRAREQ
jgi:membrane-bound lytic murein transglycosylase F